MNDSLIDREVVEELVEEVAGGDPSLLIDLFGMFQADGPARAKRISAAAAEHDIEQVEREAHSLKGSAGNLGAHRVMKLADQLMVAARCSDQAEIDALSAQIELLLEDSLRDLEALVAGYR